MPKTPRFKSEAAQKAAIGVVMLLVFAVVLGLAVWYSQGKTAPPAAPAESDLDRQSLGELSLALPAGWEPRGGLIRTELFAESPVQLHDPSPQARRLLIGRLAAPAQATLAAITRLALVKLRGVFPSILVEGPLDLESFRNDTVVGVRLAALDRQSPAGSDIQYYHYIAVVTARGGGYWLIHLQARAFTGQDERHRRLFRAICDSAELAAGRVDEGRRIEHGGVAFTLPAELRAVSDAAIEDADPPITLLPHGGDRPYLARLRVRGEIDPPAVEAESDEASNSDANDDGHGAARDDHGNGADDNGADDRDSPADSPAGLAEATASFTDPAAIFRRTFAEMHQREPEAEELLRVGGDRPRWRLVLTRPAELTLGRELWYARLGGGRGVLIELLCDEAGHNEMIAAVEALIASAEVQSPAASDDSSTASTPWQAAEQRGVALAEAQRATLAKLTGWRYYLYSIGSRSVAGRVDVCYAQAGQPQPVRGRQLQINQQDVQLEAMWWAEPDGSMVDLIWTRQTPRGFGGVHRVTRRLRFDDTMLALYDDPTFAADRAIWSVSSPPGFLPEPAEQTWSLDALYNSAASSPALIRRSEGGLPEPHWVAARRLTDNAAAALGLLDAAAVMTVRPMLTMDGHTRLLDADGAVLAGVWRTVKASPHEDQRIEMRAVDARRLQRAFPSLAATLRLWQQEVAAR